MTPIDNDIGVVMYTYKSRDPAEHCILQNTFAYFGLNSDFKE